MNKIKRMLIAWGFLFVMVCAGGLLCIGGQDAVETIKTARVNNITFNWSPKTSMKFDTIEWDWSDEEPMVEEQLLIPNNFERI